MKTIKLRYKCVSIITYIYILLPIILFLLNWLKIYIGIGTSALLIIGFLWIIKKDILTNEDIIELPIASFIISFVLIAIWVVYSGLGGYFYQTGDNHWRNAIFRDLINYSWPVIYPETNNALIYYFNFWLVPALVGKILGWSAANFALYLWGLLGINLIFLNITYYIKPKKNWSIIVTAVFLIAWSGENLIGIVISNLFGICVHPVGFGSSEGWLDFARNGYDCSYLYRSNIDALCQVYNQTIIPWLVVSMALTNPRTRTFAFIGLCALSCGPIPFIGLLPIFICLFIKEMIPQLKRHNYIYIIKEIFSVPNIMASITIFPVMWLFFKANVSFSEANGGHYIDWFVPWEAFDMPRVKTLLLFYFLEFGIYMIFIWKKYKMDSMFWIMLVTLIIIPFFKIGSIRDFCMNASLPMLLVLMVYTEKYVIDEFKENYSFKEAFNYIALIIALGVSTTTIINDYVAKSSWMKENDVFPYVADDIGTLSDKNAEEEANFLASEWENTIFFKYLSKHINK